MSITPYGLFLAARKVGGRLFNLFDYALFAGIPFAILFAYLCTLTVAP